ncbi:four-carbon acid sugar kinase family protein [Thermobifida halotolerans]|uniref:Four-carbon acid sugar kinase family protein n=1 Tax=Thermobifida halotolerans TaxID=483545 RepID=A0A399G7M4_9ACTN|nr:four-carbon acid sugar kinase family protein [Thermobifida halotolerans]UOE18067.1 four-carbon acid sugar kinase family protein [Thermobifida halotolerans]
MAQVLVIADDLIGAAATAARFARSGQRVTTVAPEHVTRAAEDYDVVVANLDSRHMPPHQAKDLVTDVVEAVWPVGLVVKRIDTTLRGNLGAEVEAAWQAVRERGTPQARPRVLLAPAFPATGRTTADGVQLLDGTPLEHTEATLDPLSPPAGGDVAELFARQSGLAVRRVPVRRVTGELLAAELAAGDEPVVLCDAHAESYLTELAEAAARAHREHGVVWLTADPGPLGALLAEALHLRGRGHVAGPLLAAVGSTTGLTRRQLDAVTRTGPVSFVDAAPDALVNGREKLSRALTDALTSHVFPDVVVVRLNASAAEVAALPLRQRRVLPDRLAEVVAAAVVNAQQEGGAAGGPSGLFTTGGDLTSAVLDVLGVRAFDVGGEVLPLTVHGVLVGGPLDGVPLIAKGGLVGDSVAIAECLGRLRRAVQTRLRTVRAEVFEHFPFTAGE